MSNIVHSTFFNADILGGLVFLVMGWIIRLFPPKNRKKIYGYRSYLSTRNAVTWREANLFAGRHSVRIAYVLLGIGVAIGLVFKSQSNWYYLLSVGAVIIATLNLRGETEWFLSQHFHDDGSRRDHQDTESRLRELSRRSPAPSTSHENG
jgi:uncharacterized membrane protein